MNGGLNLSERLLKIFAPQLWQSRALSFPSSLFRVCTFLRHKHPQQRNQTSWQIKIKQQRQKRSNAGRGISFIIIFGIIYHYLFAMMMMKKGGKQQQNRIGCIRDIRRIVRDVITIITYAHLAMWLWQWNREYISNVRNNMTMGYGILCLVWSPRLSPRSIVYSVFVIGLYGMMIKWMWWSVNRDWLWVFCRIMSIVFGGKIVYKMYWLIKDFVVIASWFVTWDVRSTTPTPKMLYY